MKTKTDIIMEAAKGKRIKVKVLKTKKTSFKNLKGFPTFPTGSREEFLAHRKEIDIHNHDTINCPICYKRRETLLDILEGKTRNNALIKLWNESCDQVINKLLERS